MAASDQTYRNQRRLDLVFGISSLLMLIAIVLLFAQDYFQPWKTEQRTFRDVDGVAALGRWVNPLCQGEDGLQHQLMLFQTSHNFVLPHASVRQPLLVPESTSGRGAAKPWRPCIPAMAAGRTDPVWSRKEVSLYRVPPWPQPHAL